MKLSIIIPCYNIAPYLSKCFKSVANQMQEGFQAIFINDGSTDTTGEVLENLAQNYTRAGTIEFIHQENKGLSESRNVGITLAKGAFITFIDGDDWVGPEYFTTLLSIVKDHSLGVVAYNRVFAHQVEARDLKMDGLVTAADWKRRLLGLMGPELRDPSQADSIVTAWGKIYHTALLVQHHISFVSTKEIGTEDLLFNLEYAQHCNSVRVRNLPLYQYRKDNVSSLTKTYKALLKEQWGKKYAYIQNRVSMMQPREQTAFQNRIALSLIGLGLNEMGNPKGSKVIRANLTSILSDPTYKAALQQLDLQYFPLHWKLFFRAAQKQQTTIVLILLKAITKILDRKNQ